MNLTPQTVRKLVSGNRNANRALCQEMSRRLRVHADGIVPESLISERRPNEMPEIKDYRRKIYKPVTQKAIAKVISSLEKIRRSQDWNIQYNPQAVPKQILPMETLQSYCELNYPVHTSLTNWIFADLLKQYLLDANGLIAVLPNKTEFAADEYIKPAAVFFRSEQILDHAEGEYVVLLSDDKCAYYRTENDAKVLTEGKIYYIITPTQFAQYNEIDPRGTLQQVQIYDHNLGVLPAFKAGGLFFARQNNETLYQSRIAAMIPDLDEAVREYSDLQAEILQHIHSEKYAYTNAECPVCNGSGFVLETDENGNQKQKSCPHCHGTGTVLNVSPYGIHIIQGARAAEQQLPNPPVGYIQKSTEIARFLDDHVRSHINDAYSCVHMEFLAETPMSESGIAKAYDRDELNNFVTSVAEDLVRIMDNIYLLINEYRYRIIVPDEEARRAMLPAVGVPSRFDIATTSALMQELQAAAQANVHPLIMRQLQVDYARKQFYTTPAIADTIALTFDLDPLFGLTDEQKANMLSLNGITDEDYRISCNIVELVRRAIEKDGNAFFAYDLDKQRDVLRKLL